MIKYVFWDNDGVLVDTERLYFQASAEVLRDVGLELSLESFVEISLRRGESVLALAGGLTAAARQRLQEARNARYGELLGEQVQVIAGVREVLQAVHGLIRMAIVTSSRRDHFRLIHRSTGLPAYFDFILTREDYTYSKPHPEPYLMALARSGVRPRECLVVEDSERGVAAARAAGLSCVAVPGDLTRGGNFEGAIRVLGSIEELPALLLGEAPDLCAIG